MTLLARDPPTAECSDASGEREEVGCSLVAGELREPSLLDDAVAAEAVADRLAGDACRPCLAQSGSNGTRSGARVGVSGSPSSKGRSLGGRIGPLEHDYLHGPRKRLE